MEIMIPVWLWAAAKILAAVTLVVLSIIGVAAIRFFWGWKGPFGWM